MNFIFSLLRPAFENDLFLLFPCFDEKANTNKWFFFFFFFKQIVDFILGSGPSSSSSSSSWAKGGGRPSLGRTSHWTQDYFVQGNSLNFFALALYIATNLCYAQSGRDVRANGKNSALTRFRRWTLA